MTFTESSTIEQMILYAATELGGDPRPSPLDLHPIQMVPGLPSDVPVDPCLKL